MLRYVLLILVLLFFFFFSSRRRHTRCALVTGVQTCALPILVHRDSSRRLSVGLPHYDRLASRASRALVLHQVTFRELLEATMALSLASIEQIGRASCRERVCQYV